MKKLLTVLIPLFILSSCKDDDILPTELTLLEDQINLYVSESKNLSANYTTGSKNPKLNWSSSNPEVVAVDDNGQITGRSTGDATITVNLNDKSLQCQISVLPIVYLCGSYYGEDYLWTLKGNGLSRSIIPREFGISNDLTNILVNNNNIYIVGRHNIWRNMVKGPAFSHPTNDNYGIGIRDFAVNGNDFYIVGYTNNDAILYKNGEGRVLFENGRADDVFIDGDDVYVAGIRKINDAHNAVLWKNDVEHIIGPAANNFYVRMGVHNSSVYITYTRPDNFSNSILLKDNIEQQIELDSDTEGVHINDMFITTTGDIYLAGEQSKPEYKSYATIWKNGKTIFVSEYNFTKVNSIHVSGNDVYAAGYRAMSWWHGTWGSSHNTAVYWVNGKMSYIDPFPYSEDGDTSIVYGLFVYDSM